MMKYKIPSNDQIAKKIKEILKSKNIPIKQVYYDLNMSQSNFYKYLRGELTWTLEMILYICNYLEIKLEDIINYEA